MQVPGPLFDLVTISSRTRYGREPMHGKRSGATFTAGGIQCTSVLMEGIGIHSRFETETPSRFPGVVPTPGGARRKISCMKGTRFAPQEKQEE
jgi:hypothetical protein